MEYAIAILILTAYYIGVKDWLSDYKKKKVNPTNKKR
jgi:hypothetical protein